MKELKFIHGLHQKFHSFLEGLSAQELQSLEKGESIIGFSLEEKQAKSKGKSIDEATLKELLIKLNGIPSRSEGMELIGDLRKIDLEFLAKEVDVPYTRSDNVERLKEKVLESTIGFRSRSIAIQNKEAQQGGGGNG